MVDFRYMTKRQQREYKKVSKLYPNLLNNQEFMYYVTETSVDTKYDATINNQNMTIAFSGFIGDDRIKYDVKFIFYNDQSFEVRKTMREHFGVSSIKFMPYTETNQIAIHNSAGRCVYVHCEKEKTQSKLQTTPDGTITKLIDEKRSGFEVHEIMYIGNSRYISVSTNMKGKTEYLVINEGMKPISICEEEFLNLGRENLDLHQKVK